MTTVQELMAYLERHYQPDDVVAADIWHRDDVRARAEDRGFAIDDALADAVIAHMDRNHDATQGFSWDTLDFWLDELLSRRTDRSTQPVGLQSSGWPAQAFFPPAEMTAPRTIGSALFLPVLPSLLGLAHPLQLIHGPSHGARSLQPIRVGLCFAGRLALTGSVPLPLTRRADDGHGCNGAAQQEEKENHHEQHHTINDRPGAVLSRRRCIMPISPCRYCSGGRRGVALDRRLHEVRL